MHSVKILTLSLSVAAFAVAAEKKVKMQDLPAPVQKAAQDQAKNGKIVGLSTETEDGKTMYEVETVVNGKTRDVLLDGTGTVVETEEEVSLDSLPAAAKEAIQKKVAGGKLKKVELLTKGSSTSYEAAYVSKNGKNAEFGVNADGSVHK